MKYLNLDFGFEPLGPSINYRTDNQNGGVPHIVILEQLNAVDVVTICTRIRSFNDLGLLLVAVDALRRMRVKNINLLLPYFPATRQDKVMLPGEALSLKLYTDLINDLEFDEVTIIDPHSTLTSALLQRVKVIPNHRFVSTAIGHRKDYQLISPNACSFKKVSQLSEHLNHSSIVECSKNNVSTIEESIPMNVYADDLEQQTCIIVSDICYSGERFIELAEALKKKNAGELILVVTHGIFSNGLKALSKHFSSIISTNSFANLHHPKLKQIKVRELLEK